MDENALKTNAQYENKIKELEDIIKQKDIEITALKNKLNNNVNNVNDEKNNKNIEISVLYKNSKYSCFENDLAYKLLEKLYSHWKFVNFMFDGKKINPFISIKENGIKDGCTIDKDNMVNLVFYGEYGSRIVSIDENYTFKKAVKYFLLRVGKEGCYDKFTFEFGKLLNSEYNTPIKDIFRGNTNPRISYYEK